MTPRIFLGISTLEDETNSLSQTAATIYAVTRHHIPEKLNPKLYHCENLNTHQLSSSLQMNHFILKARFNSFILGLFLHTASTTQQN
jgi:hypothetical protein